MLTMMWNNWYMIVWMQMQMQRVQSHLKVVQHFLMNIDMLLAYRLATRLLQEILFYPIEINTYVYLKICTWMFTIVLSNYKM